MGGWAIRSLTESTAWPLSVYGRCSLRRHLPQLVSSLRCDSEREREAERAHEREREHAAGAGAGAVAVGITATAYVVAFACAFAAARSPQPLPCQASLAGAGTSARQTIARHGRHTRRRREDTRAFGGEVAGGRARGGRGHPYPGSVPRQAGSAASGCRDRGRVAPAPRRTAAEPTCRRRHGSCSTPTCGAAAAFRESYQPALAEPAAKACCARAAEAQRCQQSAPVRRAGEPSAARRERRERRWHAAQDGSLVRPTACALSDAERRAGGAAASADSSQQRA